MRPKLIALIAVSAFALVGCASAEPEPASTVTVTATTTASAAPEAVESANPNEAIEKQFISFVDTRSTVHSVTEEISDGKAVDALHDYCEEGKPFDVSSSEALNTNLESSSDKFFCDQFVE